jgi:hypothetical protein
MTISELEASKLFTLYSDLSLLQRGALDTWRPAFLFGGRMLHDHVITIQTRAVRGKRETTVV